MFIMGLENGPAPENVARNVFRRGSHNWYNRTVPSLVATAIFVWSGETSALNARRSFACALARTSILGYPYTATMVPGLSSSKPKVSTNSRRETLHVIEVICLPVFVSWRSVPVPVCQKRKWRSLLPPPVASRLGAQGQKAMPLTARVWYSLHSKIGEEVSWIFHTWAIFSLAPTAILVQSALREIPGVSELETNCR